MLSSPTVESDSVMGVRARKGLLPTFYFLLLRWLVLKAKVATAISLISLASFAKLVSSFQIFLFLSHQASCSTSCLSPSQKFHFWQIQQKLFWIFIKRVLHVSCGNQRRCRFIGYKAAKHSTCHCFATLLQKKLKLAGNRNVLSFQTLQTKAFLPSHDQEEVIDSGGKWGETIWRNLSLYFSQMYSWFYHDWILEGKQFCTVFICCSWCCCICFWGYDLFKALFFTIAGTGRTSWRSRSNRRKRT